MQVVQPVNMLQEMSLVTDHSSYTFFPPIMLEILDVQIRYVLYVGNNFLTYSIGSCLKRLA